MKNKDEYLNRPYIRTYPGGSTSVLGNVRAWSDYVNRSVIVKGNRKSPYPHSYSTLLRKPHQGSAVNRSGSYGGPPSSYVTYDSGPFYGVIPEKSWDSWDDPTARYNIALGRLNEKVRGGLDISVAVAETSQTFRMLKAVTKAVRYVKGIGPKRWANEWLELQYGWLPLISDVYNAADELLRVNLDLMTFTGKYTERLSPSGSWSSYQNSGANYTDPSGVGPATQGMLISKYKGNVFAQTRLTVVLKLPTTAQTVARWTSLNPLSIGWELVPYSFVVDWFYDIGSYLRDTETACLYASMFSSGYRSDLYLCDITNEVKWSNYANNYFDACLAVNSKAEASRKKFSRTILTSYPSPNRPRVNTDLSSKRLLSAAALLAQFLPGKQSPTMGTNFGKSLKSVLGAKLF